MVLVCTFLHKKYMKNSYIFLILAQLQVFYDEMTTPLS